MDLNDPRTPTWKMLARTGLYLLFLGIALWEGFRDQYAHAAFVLIWAVWISVEDKIDGHFGDLRRRETKRSGTYVRIDR